MEGVLKGETTTRLTSPGFPGDTIEAQRPSGPAAQRPSGPAAQRPSGPAAQRPSGPAAQRPSGPAAQRPSGPAAQRPSGPLLPIRRSFAQGRVLNIAPLFGRSEPRVASRRVRGHLPFLGPSGGRPTMQRPGASFTAGAPVLRGVLLAALCLFVAGLMAFLPTPVQAQTAQVVAPEERECIPAGVGVGQSFRLLFQDLPPGQPPAKGHRPLQPPRSEEGGYCRMPEALQQRVPRRRLYLCGRRPGQYRHHLHERQQRRTHLLAEWGEGRRRLRRLLRR